jgi:hypothetical protein
VAFLPSLQAILTCGLVLLAGCHHGSGADRPPPSPSEARVEAPPESTCVGRETPWHVNPAFLATTSARDRLRILEDWMRLGTPESARALLSVKPASREERWLIIAGLAWSGDSAGTGRLLSALHDPMREIRECAALGIGLTGQLNWTRPLGALADSSHHIHHAELLAMGFLGTDWMLPELAAGLLSPFPRRSEMARKALCILGTEGALVLLQRDSPRAPCGDPAPPATEASCVLPPPSVETLDAALSAVLEGHDAPAAVGTSRWIRISAQVLQGDGGAPRDRAMRWLKEGRRLHPALQRPRDAEWARRLLHRAPLEALSSKAFEHDQEVLSNPVKGVLGTQP